MLMIAVTGRFQCLVLASRLSLIGGMLLDDDDGGVSGMDALILSGKIDDTCSRVHQRTGRRRSFSTGRNDIQL